MLVTNIAAHDHPPYRAHPCQAAGLRAGAVHDPRVRRDDRRADRHGRRGVAHDVLPALPDQGVRASRGPVRPTDRRGGAGPADRPPAAGARAPRPAERLGRGTAAGRRRDPETGVDHGRSPGPAGQGMGEQPADRAGDRRGPDGRRDLAPGVHGCGRRVPWRDHGGPRPVGHHRRRRPARHVHRHRDDPARPDRRTTMTATLAIALLRADGVAKSFGDEPAVVGVNLDLVAGEIHALVGLNGAGKTTLMRLLLGMVRPDAGHVTLRTDGALVEVAHVPATAWRAVGHLVETPFTYAELTVTETVRSAARLHGMTADDARAAAEQVIDELALRHWASRRTRTLSLGNRQRVGLACALVHHPDVLVLDEPTNALDPAAVQHCDPVRDPG